MWEMKEHSSVSARLPEVRLQGIGKAAAQGDFAGAPDTANSLGMDHEVQEWAAAEASPSGFIALVPLTGTLERGGDTRDSALESAGRFARCLLPGIQAILLSLCGPGCRSSGRGTNQPLWRCSAS